MPIVVPLKDQIKMDFVFMSRTYFRHSRLIFAVLVLKMAPLSLFLTRDILNSVFYYLFVMSQVWHRRISQAAQVAAFPEKIQDVFALAHNAWAKEMHFEELGKINKDVFLQHGCSIYYFRKKM